MKHEGPVGYPVDVLGDNLEPRAVDGNEVGYLREQRALARCDVANDKTFIGWCCSMRKENEEMRRKRGLYHPHWRAASKLSLKWCAPSPC